MQLRDKSCSRGGGPMLELLSELRPRCRAHGVPLFANDRADLAALAGCDGVHLGQRDLPFAAAEQVAQRGGRGLCGVSAHNQDEVTHALGLLPSYVALGPVFATTSKERADATLGIDGLRQLAAQVQQAGLAAVAIGGIDAANVAEVAKVCRCAAVIAALIPSCHGPSAYAAVADRAAALHRTLVST
jgi:thiamine-phosphate pyrophosphorylase